MWTHNFINDKDVEIKIIYLVIYSDVVFFFHLPFSFFLNEIWMSFSSGPRSPAGTVSAEKLLTGRFCRLSWRTRRGLFLWSSYPYFQSFTDPKQNFTLGELKIEIKKKKNLLQGEIPLGKVFFGGGGDFKLALLFSDLTNRISMSSRAIHDGVQRVHEQITSAAVAWGKK